MAARENRWLGIAAGGQLDGQVGSAGGTDPTHQVVAVVVGSTATVVRALSAATAGVTVSVPSG